jgi:hypothetical protein
MNRPASTMIAAALVGACMSYEPIPEPTDAGPGKGSKGITRGRIEREPNEHEVSKPQSASLKRLLRK